MNIVLIMGKYYDINKNSNNLYTLNIINENNKIPILICKTIADSINKYCRKNDLIGIKGTICINNSEVQITANKISFISHKAQ